MAALVPATPSALSASVFPQDKAGGRLRALGGGPVVIDPRFTAADAFVAQYRLRALAGLATR